MTLRSWTRPADEPLLLDSTPEDAFFLAASPDTVVFCRIGDGPGSKFPWTRIDAFTEDWNLRVRRMGGQVRAVAAGAVPGLEDWGPPHSEESLDDAQSSDARAILWGRQNEGETLWLELRVPHLMTPSNHLHPQGHDAAHRNRMIRRYLTIVRYERNGRPCFQRYTGVAYAETDAEDKTFAPLAGS
ncbi:calponin homology domain-containing protein [Salisaeta longa]|uniref:hypothetical protein n=1 Tax=Salisaeta longa TaxID=503170 RepID=UPI0012FAD99B|nr:hypothetical protein [Salisaeta longa]